MKWLKDDASVWSPQHWLGALQFISILDKGAKNRVELRLVTFLTHIQGY